MKKIIAMVLALTLLLSLATVLAATDIDGEIIGTVPGSSSFPESLKFNDSAVTVQIAPGGNFDNWNGSESISVASSDPNKLAVGYKKYVEEDGTVVYTVKLTPKKTITSEEHEVKISIALAQVTENGDKVKGVLEKTIKMYNQRHLEDDLIPQADDTYRLNATYPVIDTSVFAKVAEDKQKLTISYSAYSVVFPTVSKQDTSLYLAATTTIPDFIKEIADGGDVKYINFPGNPYLKDAAKIGVNFNNDWQNHNGTTAYVYNISGGKLVGEPIEAKIENGSVVFETKGRLGEYAIFPSKKVSTPDAEDTTDKNEAGSNNPNTGDNSTIAIAIILGTMALAATGVIAVKKASK